MIKNKSKKPALSASNKTLQLGEIPHRPHYEVRTASQSYSNIAAVLAGFAFAAVVLVIQTPPPPSCIKTMFKNWATTAFLLAFLGCVVSAFVFATVTGEEVLAPRSHTMALLGGTGFSISTNLVLFGLAKLIKIFLSQEIGEFVNVIFPIGMFLAPLFLAFSAIDPISGFENKAIKKLDYFYLFLFSFLPLIPALAIKLLGYEISISSAYFKRVMVFAFVVIIFSAATSLTISSFGDIKFRFSLRKSGIIIGVHSIVVGLIILMV